MEDSAARYTRVEREVGVGWKTRARHTLFFAFVSTPMSRSLSIDSSQPLDAAMWGGVAPFCGGGAEGRRLHGSSRGESRACDWDAFIILLLLGDSEKRGR
jgi:hypothetical protein